MKSCKHGHVNPIRYANGACKPCALLRQKKPELKAYRLAASRKQRAGLRADPIKRARAAILARERFFFRQYGITYTQSRVLLESQGGKCAICGTTKPSHALKWAVDHSHTTGRTRGVLCQHCNTALGYLRDNPDIARAAATYLEKQ